MTYLAQRIVAGLFIPALFACRADRIDAFLPLDQSRSVLFVLERDSKIDVFATDVEEELATRLPELHYETSEPIIYALGYSCSLEALRIPRGWQRTALEGGRPLPPSQKVFALEGEAEEARFTPHTGELPRIQLDLEPLSPCAQIEYQTVVIEELVDPSMMITLDDRSVLISGVRTDVLYIVSREGVRRASMAAPMEIFGGFKREDGELFLFGPRGRVMRGDLVRGFEDTASLTSTRAAERVWSDGSGSGSSFELYAVTNQQSFERFDGTRWTRLEERSAPCGSRDCTHGAVVWIAPGEALAVIPEAQELVRHVSGETRSERFQETSIHVLTAAAHVPAWASIVATDLGGLFIRPEAEDRWSSLKIFQARKIEGLIALDESALYALPGLLAEIHPVVGICKGGFAYGDLFFSAVSLGDERVLLHRFEPDQKWRATFLSWTRQKEGCPP